MSKTLLFAVLAFSVFGGIIIAPQAMAQSTTEKSTKTLNVKPIKPDFLAGGILYIRTKTPTPVFNNEYYAKAYMEGLDAGGEQKAKEVIQKQSERGDATILDSKSYIMIEDPTPDIPLNSHKKGKMGPATHSVLTCNEKGARKLEREVTHACYTVSDSEYNMWYIPDTHVNQEKAVQIPRFFYRVFINEEEYQHFISGGEDDFTSPEYLKQIKSLPVYHLSPSKLVSVKKRSKFFAKWQDCMLASGLAKADKSKAKEFITSSLAQGRCQTFEEHTQLKLKGYLSSQGKLTLFDKAGHYKCFADAVLLVVDERDSEHWVICSDIFNAPKK